MKVTFVTPHIGRKSQTEYVRTWEMESLSIATLAALTPDDVEVVYFDERIEMIRFDDPTDLAAITVETYTAKRAYEIAREFRQRGVPVVLGGYHITLIPEEAEQYADAIVIGHAESLWNEVVRDAERGQLKRRYTEDQSAPVAFGMPKRSLFQGRNYLDMSCVETGRGCPFRCNFCSITAATNGRYHPRPIDDVIADVAASGKKHIFFVDDNIVGNMRHAKDLFRELAALKVIWFSQGSLNMTRDEELLRLMAASGCWGVLIGFESLRRDTLEAMNKHVNLASGEIGGAVAKMHAHGIGIYGTFIYGYDNECADDWRRTANEAVAMKLFMGAFNPLIPFPGTALYESLKAQDRLTDNQWWLSPEFRFNDVPIKHRLHSGPQIREACVASRKRFYSIPAILHRITNGAANAPSLQKASGYLYVNYLLRREIRQKSGLPLGNHPVRPEPLYPQNK